MIKKFDVAAYQHSLESLFESIPVAASFAESAICFLMILIHLKVL